MTSPTDLPRWVDIGLLPLLNVGAAFLASGLVVLIIGENPLEAVVILLQGAFGYAVVKLTQVTPGAAPNLESVRAELETQVKERAALEKVADQVQTFGGQGVVIG